VSRRPRCGSLRRPSPRPHLALLLAKPLLFRERDLRRFQGGTVFERASSAVVSGLNAVILVRQRRSADRLQLALHLPEEKGRWRLIYQARRRQLPPQGGPGTSCMGFSGECPDSISISPSSRPSWDSRLVCCQSLEPSWPSRTTSGPPSARARSLRSLLTPTLKKRCPMQPSRSSRSTMPW